jgi:uncharacterized protein (TIGR01244 family)
MEDDMVKRVGDKFFVAVAPQRGKYDIEEAAKGGITLLINNRPDDDSTGGNDLLTMSSAEIEAQARAAGMDYVHIPVVPARISDDQITAMAEAIKRGGDGYILATCRTGMRALIMYALAQSKIGAVKHEDIIAMGKMMGFDLMEHRERMIQLTKAYEAEKAKAKG